MRLVNFLQETLVDDDDELYDYPNPLPHVDIQDPRWTDWFDRGDEMVHDWLKSNGLSWRGNVAKAKAAMSTRTRLPISELLGTEEFLRKSALSRKQGDKFSSEVPIIYRVDGINLVTDGNHRIVQAHQEGKTDIVVDVIDVDSYERK